MESTFTGQLFLYFSEKVALTRHSISTSLCIRKNIATEFDFLPIIFDTTLIVGQIKGNDSPVRLLRSEKKHSPSFSSNNEMCSLIKRRLRGSLTFKDEFSFSSGLCDAPVILCYIFTINYCR